MNEKVVTWLLRSYQRTCLVPRGRDPGLLAGPEELEDLEDVVEPVILRLVEDEADDADEGDDRQDELVVLPHPVNGEK